MFPHLTTSLHYYKLAAKNTIIFQAFSKLSHSHSTTFSSSSFKHKNIHLLKINPLSSSNHHKCFYTTKIYSINNSKCLFEAAVETSESEEDKMTVTAVTCIKDGSLLVNGKVLLTGVPDNVVVSPSGDDSVSAAFVGATSSVFSSRHVFNLGVLKDYKFLCLFRAKIWWMIPRVGRSGSEIPMETQMLLLEARDDPALSDKNSSGSAETLYILVLPVLEGQFRTSLQGTPSNELHFCVESGDANIQTRKVSEAVFISSGDNPFELIKNSVKLLARHKGTFCHIEDKKVPVHLNWFGWCTWDAFYKDVNPRGIKEGLESFRKGGCPPKFLIIDDGWQDTYNEVEKEGEPLIDGSVFASRLVDIKESSRFMSSGADISCSNLQEFVKFIKENYGLQFVYLWHALIGYWGGLDPSAEKMQKYNPKIEYPIESPGNVGNIRDIAMDSLQRYGIGAIDPQYIYDFYNDLHSYLASCGVDGVKVDIQNIVETLGTKYGGRVSLTRKYQTALEESVNKNFGENNLISCMCHNTDSIYSSKRSATARASEDFMPKEPTFHTLHLAAVAYTSLLLGEIVVPDWDMFQSKHLTAEFHGAARALGGCAVYVSDKPDVHDFDILKKLVLPDGSILRAKYAGRPTRDCLFVDPVMDGKSLMKIWNLNNLSGVLGVFNCQGAGYWPMKECPPSHSFGPLTLSDHLSPLDVDYLEEVAGKNWTGDCAVYAFHSGSLTRMYKEGKIEVSLETLQFEIFTISPIQVLNERLHFAPLGLIDMYNSGGAAETLSCAEEASGFRVRMSVRGFGRFGAYSSTKPSYITVDGNEAEFEFNADNGFLIVKLEGDCISRNIDITFKL